MKRVWILLALTLSLTSSASARALVLGGQCVGLSMRTDGVVVVGFQSGDAPGEQAGLQAGDCIQRVNQKEIHDPEELRLALRAGETAEVELLRERTTHTLTVCPDEEGKLGILVRNHISGIGTMTFYDPENGQFGALGHGIGENGLTPMAEGQVVTATVSSVIPGAPGAPGMLKGEYDSAAFGQIRENTERGVFGIADLDADSTVETGKAVVGEAELYATVSGTEVEAFRMEILDIDPNAETRNLLVQVTDERLLKTTGGIVQGMSGSPILQDGKLVGAVTHVLVNDPTTGYGIFIENMLEAAG